MTEIKLLDHLKFFLKLENETIVERQIDFSEYEAEEGMNNVVLFLEIDKFE